MACQTIRTELGIVHVCGLPAPKPCHFCGDQAEYLCDWKVERFTIVPAGELVIGDRVPWPSDKKKRSMGLIFKAINEKDQKVALAFDTGASLPLVKTYIPLWGTYQTLRPATCDQPCCENCAREVGEEHHHCRDHWDTWRQIS